MIAILLHTVSVVSFHYLWGVKFSDRWTSWAEMNCSHLTSTAAASSSAIAASGTAAAFTFCSFLAFFKSLMMYCPLQFEKSNFSHEDDYLRRNEAMNRDFLRQEVILCLQTTFSPFCKVLYVPIYPFFSFLKIHWKCGSKWPVVPQINLVIKSNIDIQSR